MSARIFFKDESEIMPSHTGDDVVNHFINVRTPVKFLYHFAHNFLINNSEFLTKLNKEFRLVFENWANKKIGWKKMSLIILPCDSYLHLYKDVKTGHLIYNLYCCVGPVMGIVEWYINLPNFEIDMYNTSKLKEEINVKWIPDRIYSQRVMDEIPKYEEKISKLKFNTKPKFPVFSWLDSMPHEGKFAITLLNTEDTDKVSTSLEKTRSDWNKQTDKARETGDESLERGYCHDIAFDGLDGKVGYWYVDAGSAHDGIHEFLLQGLSESGIKIKHVEIQGL
jgi:hypothetical protein